jgi:hypothetical protein
VHTIIVHGTAEVQLHSSSTTAPHGGEWSVSSPSPFIPSTTKYKAKWATEPVYMLTDETTLAPASDYTAISSFSSPWCTGYTAYAIPVLRFYEIWQNVSCYKTYYMPVFSTIHGHVYHRAYSISQNVLVSIPLCQDD